jgi:hypothetical protein
MCCEQLRHCMPAAIDGALQRERGIEHAASAIGLFHHLCLEENVVRDTDHGSIRITGSSGESVLGHGLHNHRQSAEWQTTQHGR